MPLTIPDILFDAFQRYKQSTAVVIDWMLQQAGPDTELGPDIRVAQLFPLAQQLATRTEPRLEVPSGILNALRKTISLRERCTVWYKQKASIDASLHESNERHEHFSNVLKDVQLLLEAHRASTKPTIAASGGVGKSILTSQNVFKPLDVEHTMAEPKFTVSEHPGGAAATTPNTFQQDPLAHASKTTMEETMITEEDPYMAVFLMLEETLDPLRHFVIQRWEHYHAGKIHLSVASTITNIAIGMARRIESDFLSAFPNFSDWEDIMANVLSSVTNFEQRSSASWDKSSLGMLNSAFYVPYQQLRRFRESHQRQQNPGTQGSEGLSPEPSNQEDRKKEARQDDRSEIGELLVGALLLQIRNEALPTQDELVFGLKGIFGGDKISLWVVFGLQLVLDILHVQGAEVTQGLEQLRATASVFAANIDRHAIFLEAITGSELSKTQHKRLLSNVRLIDRWITSDNFIRMQEISPRTEPKLDPFSFFSHNAFASGLLQTGVLLHMQRRGIENINANKNVLAMAHIYNILKSEERLDAPWQDMEDFLRLHKQEYLISNKDSGEFKAHLACLQMAIEGSIQSVPSNMRNMIDRSFHSQQNPGCIKQSEMTGAFEGMLCPEEGTKQIVTVDQISQILLRGTPKRESGDDSIYTEWQESHKLDPIKLLQLLQERMEADQPRLLFNYQALHHTCWQLLREIEQDMHGEFEHWLKVRSDSPKGNMNLNLYLLGFYLLEDVILVGRRPFVSEIAIEKEMMIPRRDMLTRAERVLGRFLMEEGGDGWGKADGVLEEFGPAVLWGILESD